MAFGEHDEAAPDGLAQLQAMLGTGLRAPMGETLGFELIEVERGRVVFEGRPDRRVYNPMGAMHGGYPATLLLLDVEPRGRGALQS
jgi:acyl-coenzyme A thioesterase PaaI-like protein